MSLHNESPTAVVEHCGAMIGSGEIEGILAHYHPDLVFAVSPQRIVHGVDAARVELRPFFELTNQKMVQYEHIQSLQFENIALVSYRFRLEGTGPDGKPASFSGVSSDVLRREQDGSWIVIIDNPMGGNLGSYADPD